MGLNLEANRARIDQTEAHQYLALLSRRYIGALEIGNEPDLYPVIPWYKLVDVHSPAGWGSRAASIERLLAPTAAATSDITLGGQSFTPSSDGIPAAPQHLTVSPRRGAYTIKLAPATAALLTLSPPA